MADIGYIAKNGVDIGRIYEPGNGTQSLGLHDFSGVDIGTKFMPGSGGPASGYESYSGGQYKDLNRLLSFGATQILFGWFGNWGSPIYRPGGPGFDIPTTYSNHGWEQCQALRDNVRDNWSQIKKYFYPVPPNISLTPWGGGSTQGFGCCWRVFTSGMDPNTEIEVNTSITGHNHSIVEKVSKWCVIVAMYSDDWDWRRGTHFSVDINVRVPGFPLVSHHGYWKHHE